VGDSFLQGWNVRAEALLPHSAQAELARRGVAAECFSLSGSGHGTGQELLHLRRHGARVAPDWVVLCVYSGNDVIDNSLDLAGRTTVSAGAWVRPYFVLDEAGELEQTWLHPWRARLRAASRLYTLLDHRAYRRRYRDQGQYLREEEERPVAPMKRLLKGLVMGADMELFLAPEPGSDWERAWRTSEALLVAFERETRALGAHLLVVVIPHVAQVESNAIFRQADGFMQAAGQRSMLERLDLELPERRLQPFLASQGIPASFLLEELRADTRASGVSSYLHDGHFNSHGQALAGRSVGARLAALLAGEAEPSTTSALEGGPVDVLAQLWSTHRELSFDAPFEDVIGQGWHGWACDQAGLGPGWAMKREGWLVLARGARYVLEAVLPPTARVPLEFRAKDHLRAYSAPLTVTGPGPFELPIDTGAAETGPAWIPVLIQASQDFPDEPDQPALVLKALRRVE
jgi:hypothetical protein